ncbi:MAG: hypothetical protein U1E48_11605 [Paracoccaceae bacterium]
MRTSPTAITPKRPDAAQVCEFWFNGVYDGRTLTVIYNAGQTEHSTSSRSLSVRINKDGALVDPAYPAPALAAAILWIRAALMIARFAFSFGQAAPRPARRSKGRSRKTR